VIPRNAVRNSDQTWNTYNTEKLIQWNTVQNSDQTWNTVKWSNKKYRTIKQTGCTVQRSNHEIQNTVAIIKYRTVKQAWNTGLWNKNGIQISGAKVTAESMWNTVQYSEINVQYSTVLRNGYEIKKYVISEQRGNLTP
jgi:hypothetical protein